MAKPYNPNNGPANAARTRKRLDRNAAELRAAGWTCTPPDDDTAVTLDHLRDVHGITENVRASAAVELHTRQHYLHELGQRVDPHVRSATPKE